MLLCKTCSSNIDPENRLLEPPFCGCIPNFYENPVDEKCYECTNAKCN